MVIPIESFLDFLSQYQGEIMLLDDAKKLIDQHEPHPDLKRRHLLSFEGRNGNKINENMYTFS